MRRSFRMEFLISQIKRPDEQFSIYEHIKKDLVQIERLKKCSYQEKLIEVDKILSFLIKQLETKRVEIDIRLRYREVLGELILHEDIGNIFNDNKFDSMILKNDNNPKLINFGDKILKVNWKNVLPKALTEEVSLTQKSIDEYKNDKISVVFIIKNSSDPNYYRDIDNMYFPDGKITTEGFQYYLLHYNNFDRGKVGQYWNRYYKIENNGILINMGLRYKNTQLTLNEFLKNEQK